MEKKERSQPVTSTLAFLLAVVGELFLLRGHLATGLSALSTIVLAELAFCVLILFGAGFTVTPKGWRGKTGSAIALTLYTAYLVFNLINFTFFKDLYLSCIVTEHKSYGPAVEAFKLVLVLIGTVAAIPVASGPKGREYMRGLERAVQRQQAEWARNGSDDSKSELDKTLGQIRKNLTPEERKKLLSELEKEDAGESQVGSSPPEAKPEPSSEKFSSDDWKGWNCG
ncbi:hypothetical protein SDC9_47354 [bioreactor metagenome]|uniref:Uncharacterized protein n=1 Tax=bioreactor metagenome TaxID=1076179 RepID=A0A644WBB1_9ZZZZ